MGAFSHKLRAAEASVFGENLAGARSIEYEYLYSRHFMFSIRDEILNRHADWDTVLHWSRVLGIPTVPVMRIGKFKRKAVFEAFIKKVAAIPHMGSQSEGVVVRTWNGFDQKSAEDHTAKWVREDHVQGTLPRQAVETKLFQGEY